MRSCFFENIWKIDCLGWSCDVVRLSSFLPDTPGLLGNRLPEDTVRLLKLSWASEVLSLLGCGLRLKKSKYPLDATSSLNSASPKLLDIPAWSICKVLEANDLDPVSWEKESCDPTAFKGTHFLLAKSYEDNDLGFVFSSGSGLSDGSRKVLERDMRRSCEDCDLAKGALWPQNNMLSEEDGRMTPDRSWGWNKVR